MTLHFDHTTLGQRVRFGTGQACALVADEVRHRGAKRVMVIATTSASGLADEVTEALEGSVRFDQVVQHVPVAIAELARSAAAENVVDLLVCLGGGSATGLAKAVALTTGIPIVAVPTTYAGSEATSVWGITEDARKATGIDDRVLPQTVIYDAQLTVSLPVELSVASGLNSIAHCVDSLWAPRTDPINQALAVEGLRALSVSLRTVHADPRDISARELMLYGTYLAGVAFASAGSGMHHKICHVLGGAFNLPHAQTHAVVLPYVLAFNVPSAPEVAARLATALQGPTALEGLEALRRAVDAPRALRDIGFREDQIPEAVMLCLDAVPDSNPRAVDFAALERILRAAWAGDPAETLSTR